MDKNKIKKLAKKSFKGSSMDQERVLRISKLLNRSSLKEYVRSLRKIDDDRTIYIEVFDPDLENLSVLQKKLKKAFPNKKLVVRINKELIGGIRIINGDLTYELSLRNLLEEAISNI